MEVLGYEEGEIKLQSLFVFRETGTKDEKIKGKWMRSGELVKTEKLVASGYRIPGIQPGGSGK